MIDSKSIVVEIISREQARGKKRAFDQINQEIGVWPTIG